MPLVTCQDCNAEISDAAPACPKCGRPMNEEPQIVEATGKGWKLIQAAGVLALFFGVAQACKVWNVGQEPDAPNLVAFWLITGVAVIIVGRVGAWWNHG